MFHVTITSLDKDRELKDAIGSVIMQQLAHCELPAYILYQIHTPTVCQPLLLFGVLDSFVMQCLKFCLHHESVTKKILALLADCFCEHIHLYGIARRYTHQG